MFFRNPAAFAPFFTERVTVSVKRGTIWLDVDCRAALWEGGLDGPIGTGDIDSQRDVVSVLVPLGGPFSWPTQEQIPVAGSKIRLADGRMVHVTEVQKRVHCIAMEGRTA